MILYVLKLILRSLTQSSCYNGGMFNLTIPIQQSHYTVKRIDSKLNCDRDGEYDLLRAE